MIGAGHPQRVVPLHAPPADEHVLQGVVERMAHVQGAGYVGRGDDDAEGFARVGTGVEIALLVPEPQPTLLGVSRVVLFGQFGGHAMLPAGSRGKAHGLMTVGIRKEPSRPEAVRVGPLNLTRLPGS